MTITKVIADKWKIIERKKCFGKVIYENVNLIDKDVHRFYYKKYFLWMCYEKRYNLSLLECINEGIYQDEEFL